MDSGVFQANYPMVIAIYLVLALVGTLYNLTVAWLERRQYSEGYLSLLVALGVTLTVAPLALISPEWTLITLGAFIASGTPMIVGSILRYLQRRERERRRIAELLDGKENRPPA